MSRLWKLANADIVTSVSPVTNVEANEGEEEEGKRRFERRCSEIITHTVSEQKTIHDFF